MELVFIESKDNKYFDKAWQLYLDSFPEVERRTLEEQEEILTDKNFKMTCYVEDEVLISIVFFWKIYTKNKIYTFLEHFAVNSELRGQSYGSKILEKFISDNKNIVLEIEPIVDEITQKRLNFYERFDFVVNCYEHLQIPFRKDAQELKLVLMSQQKTLSQQEYKELYESMKKSLKRF
ncbi:GNAT family N-acetyltransferase [Halarcobacter sp.]|uniref:GNAT family N-acetyltransferase n=1 Tax=Halarcobacter sp. TaxID=2321133 RepID=UPI003A8E5952